MPRAWGFIDGPIRRVARPSHEQRLGYSGLKRPHTLMHQSVVMPDDILRHLLRSILGRRHDATMLRRSGLLGTLRQHFMDVDGQPCYLYMETQPTHFHRGRQCRIGAGWTRTKIRSKRSYQHGPSSGRVRFRHDERYLVTRGLHENPTDAAVFHRRKQAICGSLSLDECPSLFEWK